MHWDTGRLRDIPAFAIEDRSGIVEQLAHDSGTAGTPDRDVHFGSGRGQGVVDDLKFDRRDLRVRLHLSSPRDEVAVLVAMAIPALEQQHGRICLLDDGGSRHHPVERDLIAVPHRHLAPAAGEPDHS